MQSRREMKRRGRNLSADFITHTKTRLVRSQRLSASSAPFWTCSPSGFHSVLPLDYLLSQRESYWYKDSNRTKPQNLLRKNKITCRAERASRFEKQRPPKKKRILNSGQFWSKFKESKVYNKSKARKKKSLEYHSYSSRSICFLH